MKITAAKRQEIAMSPQFGTLCAVCHKSGWHADKKTQETLIEVTWQIFKEKLYTREQFEAALKRFVKLKQTEQQYSDWSFKGFVDNLGMFMVEQKPTAQVGQSPQPHPDYVLGQREMPCKAEFESAKERMAQKIPALAKILERKGL